MVQNDCSLAVSLKVTYIVFCGLCPGMSGAYSVTPQPFQRYKKWGAFQ